ncbi:MAG: hypothetical protein IPP16_00010 [Acidimicrobiaceae bacterium]|nr:hypothetical protein [Acidimicrobiaceae bacterium]
MLTVTAKGDTSDELDEYFEVVISAPPVGVALADPIGRVTILDDDPRPTVLDCRCLGGGRRPGTRSLVFTVTLSAPTGDTVASGWATDDGTARRANNDYQAAAGIVVFNPGETTRTITVKVNGDTRVEANETFRVTGAIGVGHVRSQLGPPAPSPTTTDQPGVSPPEHTERGTGDGALAATGR